MNYKTLLLTLTATLPAVGSFAQGPGGGPPPGPPVGGQQPQGGPRPGGPQGGPNGQRPPGEPPRGPMPLIHALDTDDDGIISATEMEQAPDSLKKLDKNGDGKLTPDEWLGRPPEGPGGQRPPEGPGAQKRAPRVEKTSSASESTSSKKENSPDGKRQGPPLPQIVEALDADHDGTISAEEIAGATEALKKLDKNNDGQLGPREYGPRPPKDRGQDGPPPADAKDKPAI